jgi:LPXTG-motif cell wall-anchored protein
MKRILTTLFGIALLMLVAAAPAAADYPPSPTQTPTRGPTQTPTQSFTQTPTQSFTQTPTLTPSVEGSETHSPSASTSVLGETVTVSPGSGGTAFTGSDVAGPLALGGILLVLGLALLYAGRRRAASSDR